jgi:hypothetical protein
MSGAVAGVLAGMTRKAIAAMTPADVMRLVMTESLTTGDLKLAYMAATDLAPYYHPKLSAVAAVTSEGDGFGKLLEVLEQRRRRPKDAPS